MLDANFIREKPEDVKKAVLDRGYDKQLVNKWLELDKKWREVLVEVEELRAERNQLVEEYKKKGKKPPEEVIEKGQKLKEGISTLEEDLKSLEEERLEAQYAIPNIPAKEVPYGKDDRDNVKIKEWGKKKKLDFQPENHLKIGEKLEIIDVNRAGKVSGPRFGYFIGDGALLEMALMQFTVNKIRKHGFKVVIPPVLIKKEVERKMGYVEHGNWREMYKTQEDNLILASSSEHSVIPMHMNEAFKTEDLPIRYVNYSTCFRREAGSYGKDTKGMFRVHQFNKVEMNVYTLPDLEVSDSTCQQMLKIQEELMQELGIPYQIVASSTGDLPFPNRLMFDIEAWFPSEERYRETHSCSNCTDFQTRRLNIRVDHQGETKFVHALNATGVTDRVLLAVLENYQQKDGSVKVPEVLQQYVGKDVI
jgi:seryl-tRNA synthetase